MSSLSLLIKIRWLALASIVFAFCGATYFLSFSISALPFSLVCGAIVLTNVFASKSQNLLAPLIFLDIVLVTYLLYSYGGHANPFSTIYLAYVTLAGFFLPPALTWLSVVLTSLAFGALFFWHIPISELQSHHSGASGFDLHLQGMLVSYIITASLIALFSGRLKKMLIEREKELAERKEKEIRLASLTTLAAGAAHELATPLSTIAVLAKDLENEVPDSLLPDCEEISEAVGRARQVLEKMSGKSGELVGETPKLVTFEQIEADLLSLLSVGDRKRIGFAFESDQSAILPKSGLVFVLASIIKNAFDASGNEGDCFASFATTENSAKFTIIDYGVGIPEDIISRLGEPFLTTKEPGSGMGLGIFLARIFAERWQGQLKFESKLGKGTKVTLILPNNCSSGLSRAA